MRWPCSLAGQMALLVALALFVAQAINFAFILRARGALRLEQASGPPAVRIADALEREADGRLVIGDRGRVRRLSRDPLPAALPRRPEVAAELRRKLVSFGVAVRHVDAAIVPLSARRRDMRRRLDPGSSADVRELLIAVERPGGDWLMVRAPWPEHGGGLFAWLMAQTLLFYVLILLPVLWLARRISRPLRALAADARQFAIDGRAAPVPETGPADVRGVIAAYNELGVRVRAMLDEKDRMLGALGHDLRTPLAALRVRVESVEDEQDRARMADTIDEMNRMLDDILSLARLGRPSEPVTEVDVAALVDAVVEDFRDLGQDVSFDPPGRMRLALRAVLIRRAVRNLIENAVKYAGAAEVTVSRGAAHAIHITVADRGPGIAPDRLAEVFEPFTRIETSRNRDTGGVGLGLALARAIVLDARGTLSLAARAGGGLVATIMLPPE